MDSPPKGAGASAPVPALPCDECPDLTDRLHPGQRHGLWLHIRERTFQVEGVFPVSPSSFLAYHDSEFGCPRRWKLDKVDRMPKVEIHGGALGRRFHVFIAAAIDGRELEDRDLPPIPREDADDWRWLRRSARRLAEELRRRDDEIVGTEQRLEQRWSVGGVEVHALCIVDVLLIDRMRVGEEIDWKTGYKVPRSLKDDLQMGWGAVALRERYPQVEAVRARHYHLRRQQPLFAFLGPDRIDRFEAEIRAGVEVMVADAEHKPKPSGQCFTCPHVHKCDAGLRHVQTELQTGKPLVIDTPEAKRAWARALTQLSALYDAAKAPLENETAWTGPAPVTEDGSQAWGHWPKQFVEIVDEEQLVADLKRLGAFDRVIDINVSKLKAVLKQHPQLRRHLKTRVETYFGFRKNLTQQQKELPE